MIRIRDNHRRSLVAKPLRDGGETFLILPRKDPLVVLREIRFEWETVYGGSR